MSRKILSLEIREESIAAVLLDSSFKGSLLEMQGYFPIPAGKEGNEGVKKALQAIVETFKPSGATCVLGIPATIVSVRNLSVPFHDIKKIRQILPFELEPTLPIPVEDLIFDFEAVKHDKQQNLLTFSVEKTEIQRYLDLLEAVHLRPAVIMPGGYAAARFISTMTNDSGDFLFIDTGEGNHTIYAVCSGHVRMVRTLPVASDGNPVTRNLETTLKRTFIALQENLGIGFNPSAVFSAGPQAPLLTTGNGSSTLLDVPVKSIDGLRTFPRLKGSLDTQDWQSGHLDIALALALMETETVAGVNFSTERSTIQHYWSEYRKNIILTAALIALALVTALGVQILAVNAKQQRLAELDRQIESVFRSTFPEVTRVVNPLQQMQIKIKEAGDGSIGFNLTGARVRVIDILNALSQQIPSSADVKVKRMVAGTDNVVLSGNTDTFNTVDDIKGRLEEADLFKSVTISSADLEKSGNRVRFKLKLDF
ncbi:type II secretion system protein GspL [Desulfosarcina sp.]|uniref:type II secretion system protein GspL n=1 Tax=Desulfosarcina sp. TaxID=2027861 RepID=UPI0029BB6F1B|nr:type II secretion system protein GspL [Desulfosarcina sp.]MDX2451468.1 type II secretion system protein GspL [Desulfosarcina sp.]MDX2489284.1 type II secretion system protein GspL [Desulfosarcina sp.]